MASSGARNSACGSGYARYRKNGCGRGAIDEVDRGLREQVAREITRRRDVDPRAVLPEPIGVLPVRLLMGEIAERLVEALSLRQSRRALVSQSPLADERRAIAARPEDLGHRDVAVLERQLAVAADAAVARVQPGHQGGARRRADGAARVVLREPRALRGQAIDVGRAELLLPVRGEVTPAEIVGVDEDDIGRARGGGGCLPGRRTLREGQRHEAGHESGVGEDDAHGPDGATSRIAGSRIRDRGPGTGNREPGTEGRLSDLSAVAMAEVEPGPALRPANSRERRRADYFLS